MIALQHPERERRNLFHTSQEAERRPRVRTFRCPRVCKSRAYIQSGEYIYSRTVVPHQMYGIELHQISWFLGLWSCCGNVQPFPGTALFEEVVSIERTLHR